MGKGDKRSKRGKIFRGSYGKSRPRKRKAKGLTVSNPTEIKPKEKTKEKK